MISKTGSELSRRFSNRTGSDGSALVTSRAPEVSGGSRHISARWYDAERSYCCARTLLHGW